MTKHGPRARRSVCSHWPRGTPCPRPSRGCSPPASALANSWQKAGAPSWGAEGSPRRPWKQQEVESNSQVPVQYRKVGEPPLSRREATARACGQDGPASGPASRVWLTTGLSRCLGLSCTCRQSSASTLPGKDPLGHGCHASQLHLPGTRLVSAPLGVEGGWRDGDTHHR